MRACSMWLAYGFETAYLYKFNKTSADWDPKWTATNPGHYASAIAIGQDNVAIGWDSYGFLSHPVMRELTVGGAAVTIRASLTWRCTRSCQARPPGPTTQRQRPASTRRTHARSRLPTVHSPVCACHRRTRFGTDRCWTVANWGAQNDTSPTVLVFAPASPTPLLAYATPGSMFDIDIVRSGNNAIVRFPNLFFVCFVSFLLRRREREILMRTAGDRIWQAGSCERDGQRWADPCLQRAAQVTTDRSACVVLCSNKASFLPQIPIALFSLALHSQFNISVSVCPGSAHSGRRQSHNESHGGGSEWAQCCWQCSGGSLHTAFDGRKMCIHPRCILTTIPSPPCISKQKSTKKTQKRQREGERERAYWQHKHRH
jgi:hypothetical protein